MVKIRLAVTGRKKRRSYRVVVAEDSKKRDGRFIEIIGFYNPQTKLKKLSLKKERLDYWLSVGAQPTEAVKKLIEINKT